MMAEALRFTLAVDCPELKWEKILEKSLFPSYRQNLAYLSAKESIHRTGYFFYITDNQNTLLGAVYYLLKRYKYNMIIAADIPAGHIFLDEIHPEMLSQILDHYISWAKSKNASYIKYNPWLPVNIGEKNTGYESVFQKIMKDKGFKSLLPGRHTYWIDLTKSEEQILSNMKRQTRYDIRKSIKSKIKVTYQNTHDEVLIDKFYELYKTLGTKKQFSMYSENKFKQDIKNLLNTGIASMFVLRCDDRIVNISMASKSGIASYLHGAINPDFRELKECLSPGQLAQWEMITTAKREGAKWYDLGFCPGPIPIKNHENYGIWRFKYGFGGDHVEFLPIYGKVLSPIKGRLFERLLK